VPGLKFCHDVPPALVTQGCDSGSSTAAPAVPQSNAPSSPAEAKMLCPWAAICSKTTFSAWAMAAPSAASHSPQLVLIVDATSSLAILVYSSSSVWPVSSLGAL
jgi:hypothetical protein